MKSKKGIETADVILTAILLMVIGFGLTVFLLPIEREYEQIAIKNANSFDYNYPSFVCTNFSDNLVLQLKAKGWFAFKQTIDLPQENCVFEERCLHSVTVLVLPIESVSGEVLIPEKWKEREYEFFGGYSDCSKCMNQFEAD